MLIGRLVFGGVALLFALINAEPASACYNQQFVGVWENPEAAGGDIVRVEIAQDCQFDANGNWSAKAETIWKIRAWSRCRPRDCTWGRTLGREDGSGPLTAIFETFSATRLLELNASGNHLDVRYRINYRNARQKDVAGVVRLMRVD